MVVYTDTLTNKLIGRTQTDKQMDRQTDRRWSEKI